MYEDEIKDLLLRRKELMDELDPLYVNYEDLKAHDASVSDINKVAREINKRVDEVRSIDAKLDEYQSKMDELPEVEVKEENEEVEPEKHTIVEVDNNDSKKHLTAGGIIALSAVMLATGIGGTLLAEKLFKNKNCAGRCANNDNIYNQVETDVNVRSNVNADEEVVEVIVPTITPEATLTPTSTVAPTVEPTATPAPTAEPTVAPTAEPIVAPTVEPTVTPIVTPEPGLTDPTNENDVEAAVDIIYEQDLNPMIKGLNNPAFEAQVTREDIADIVRFVNGELPINKKYDKSQFNDYASKFVYVYGAQGGHANELYPVHYENLAVKGSALSKYCKEYDDIYNRIAAYRAAGNVDGVVEEVGYLTSKLYNEWHLFGMYGGWNPYLFSDEELFLAFNASVGRYANYVKEYLISNDLTVCIDGCVDVEKDEYKKIETRDVYEAMLYGTSKNNEVSIMIGDNVFNPNEYVSNALQHTLNEKSEQAVKSLK